MKDNVLRLLVSVSYGVLVASCGEDETALLGNGEDKACESDRDCAPGYTCMIPPGSIDGVKECVRFEHPLDCEPGDTRPCGTNEGVCEQGRQHCVDGYFPTDDAECEGEVIAQDKDVCDAKGLDEDCDGGVDEGCDCENGATQKCGPDTDKGVCRYGEQQCVFGAWGSCDGAVYPGNVEECDEAELDDDCDGAANEGCDCVNGDERACGPDTDVGICEYGRQVCVGGEWSECDGDVYPQDEECDSEQVDSDCDGDPSNGCDCLNGETRVCGDTDVGVCEYGDQECEDGAWSTCEGAVYPEEEICDKDLLDHDCDGILDDVQGEACDADEVCNFGGCVCHPDCSVRECGVDPGCPWKMCGPCDGEEFCDGFKCVSSYEGVNALSCGSAHVCASMTNGNVSCWGGGSNGQLGVEDNELRASPESVLRLMNGVAGLGAGGAHTCTVMIDGRAMCWGVDTYGELGNGGSGGANAPNYVLWNVFTELEKIYAGSKNTCGLTGDGTGYCWGWNENGEVGNGTAGAGVQKPVPSIEVNGFGVIRMMSPGGFHGCALYETGDVRCWGGNARGQLGNGTRLDRLEPSLVSLPEPSSWVSAGGWHSCALTDAGEVYCWGYNHEGQLGAAMDAEDFAFPAVVGLPSEARSVVAGYEHTCAVLRDGAVWCWGNDSRGQLGDGGTNASQGSPVEVKLGRSAVEVCLGEEFTCARLEDGGVFCWGGDQVEQLGDGVGGVDRSTPVAVNGFP
ncbi:MAG: hypothetical protein B7733_18710 [Myxococcales bacterium FL481]|nr:MAG: hypothetical protein B7733_18710 [Myxococcales bacterium FL481]